MNNLKKFQQLNKSKLNDGLISMSDKMFNSKKLTNNSHLFENSDNKYDTNKISIYFENMVRYIINNFQIKNLRYKEDLDIQEDVYTYGSFNNLTHRKEPDIIEIYKESLLIFVNKTDITNLVNRKDIQILLNFFIEKYKKPDVHSQIHDTLKSYFQDTPKNRFWYAYGDDEDDEDDDECEDEEDCSSY